MDTKISFQKTSCYFCSEWLDDRSIKDHLLTCGQVLEKCQYNCLSYIQRKNMEKHLKRCAKRPQASFENLTSDADDRISMMEENLIFLRKSLNEEIQMRHEIIDELGSLKKRNQITDEWTVKVSEVLNLLQKRIEEEKESRKFEMKDLNGTLGSLLKEFQNVKNARQEINKSLNNMESKFTSAPKNSELLLSNNEWKNEFKRLEMEVDKLKFQSSDDINDCVKYISTINDKLNQIALVNENKQTFTDDSLMQNLERLDKFEAELATTKTLLNNLSDRHSKTDYNIKQVQNTVHETEDKTDKLDKEVAMYKEIVYGTKQNLSDLKEHLKVQRQFQMISNIRGHLIWKISRYSKRLEDSKQSDVPLKSPLFSNKHYGYALRLDVHPNGIGMWKNRNLIACLTVVNGEYDTLLQWPCKLKADIILRDQPDDLNNATDITKLVITKKRNDKLEYQNQFIHIPHQVINSGNYIKNDAIILEVKVQKTYEGVTLKSITPTQI